MRSIAVAVIAVAFAHTLAHAQSPADTSASGGGGRPDDKGALGVGIILGEPTGVTARLYLKSDQAVQAAAGFAFVGGGLQIDADYVFHPWILQDRDKFVLPVYIGPGVRFVQYRPDRSSNYFATGVRAVIGMLFDFKEVPLDVFFEVAGVLEYRFEDGKGAGASLNAGAGIRYYF